jgi:hypothetical protein
VWHASHSRLCNTPHGPPDTACSPGTQEQLAALKRRRQREREAEGRDAKRLAASQEGKKVGDAGYRYHARVPRAAQPDYVNAPQAPESVWPAHLCACVVGAHVCGCADRGRQDGKDTAGMSAADCCSFRLK